MKDKKKRLLKFTQRAIAQFLQEHPEETFYAFAYDCIPEYGYVYLALNTEAAFEETLEKYRAEEGEIFSNNEKAVFDLKYSINEWKYDNIRKISTVGLLETFFVLKGYSKQYKSPEIFFDELMNLYSSTLIAFSKTDTFEKIPKTHNFNFFCTRHDENIKNAEQRMERVKALHS